MFCLRSFRVVSGLARGQFRTFMSPGFACADAWEKRLKSKILSQVNLEEMYCDLENKYGTQKTVSGVDIDIFTNSINSDSHIQEMEDLIYKFRLSSQASNILPSTHHAFIKAFHKFGDVEDLMRILDDRLNYGIFPDDYSLIFLMDDFINKGDFKNAAKMACLNMLQENFENPLLNHMSIYSCHKYLLNPVEWSPPVEEPVDDGEEVRVRVKYLRNPYFDGHFDLRGPNDLIGKTLLLVGRELQDISHEILGAVLHSKYEVAQKSINDAIQNKNAVHDVCLKLALAHLNNIPIKEGEEGNEIQKQINSMTSSIENLKTKVDILTEDPLIKTDEMIKSIVKQTEEELIAKQKKVYEEWELMREEVLMEELEELKRLARIKQVEEVKEKLKKTEEKLFFFENEDQMDLKIENKRVPLPRKWYGKKKKKKSVDVEYVPPEIIKKRTTSL